MCECGFRGTDSDLRCDLDPPACPDCESHLRLEPDHEAEIAYAEYRAGIPQAQRLMRDNRICNGDDMVRAIEREEAGW